MKVKYFKDTDTALLEFSNESITETKDINDNIYIDLDALGAKQRASLPEVVVEQFDQGGA